MTGAELKKALAKGWGFGDTGFLWWWAKNYWEKTGRINDAYQFTMSRIHTEEELEEMWFRYQLEKES